MDRKTGRATIKYGIQEQHTRATVSKGNPQSMEKYDYRPSSDFICNISNNRLTEFKFNKEDEFSLPVKLENDVPLPKYSSLTVPEQGGSCANEKEYPGFWIKWEKYNEKGYITIHQPTDTSKMSAPFTKNPNAELNLFDGSHEHTWQRIKVVPHQNNGDFLNGLIIDLSTYPDKDDSKKEKNFPEVELTIGQSIREKRNTAERHISGLKDSLQASLKVTKENLYYEDTLIPNIEKKLTVPWLLKIGDKMFQVLCTPNIKLPWEGRTRGSWSPDIVKLDKERDLNGSMVVMHTGEAVIENHDLKKD
ncbi:MAG: hypothetical protein K0R14_1648 [Burkholderiales bacterium]|jgi:hypothetical protein|nr:hypothetical protein [Burkholderiales bacterium]